MDVVPGEVQRAARVGVRFVAHRYLHRVAFAPCLSVGCGDVVGPRPSVALDGDVEGIGADATIRSTLPWSALQKGYEIQGVSVPLIRTSDRADVPGTARLIELLDPHRLCDHPWYKESWLYQV